MARASEDFQGLVLTRQPYRESDLLVKFLTDRFGKKMFLLHRARKPGFRMAAGILPFTAGHYVGTMHESGLSYLTAVKEARQFQAIAQDIELNAYASYLLSLVDMAFEDGLPTVSWYHRAAQALTLIDAGMDAAVVVNIVEVQLLSTFGFAPEWRGCVLDGRTDLPLDFSEQYGGLLCQAHWGLDPYRYRVAPKALYLLRQFSVLDLNQVHSIAVNAATKAELRRVLDRLYQDMVGVVPKAKKFLEQMPTWQDKLPPTTR